MRVTIMADASFCPNTGATGYGYWIASERGKRGGGGHTREPCLSSTAAEMIAVVNALHQALIYKLAWPSDNILFQTDCQAAIGAFNGARQFLPADQKNIKNKMDQLRARFQLNCTFKHVKGHSNIKEAKYLANNHCDRKAYRYMQKARKLLKRQLELSI